MHNRDDMPRMLRKRTTLAITNMSMTMGFVTIITSTTDRMGKSTLIKKAIARGFFCPGVHRDISLSHSSHTRDSLADAA
jgi:hypothetical protein